MGGSLSSLAKNAYKDIRSTRLGGVLSDFDVLVRVELSKFRYLTAVQIIDGCKEKLIF